MAQVNQTATWKENYTMTIRLAFVLVIIGFGFVYLFDGWVDSILGFTPLCHGVCFLFLGLQTQEEIFVLMTQPANGKKPVSAGFLFLLTSLLSKSTVNVVQVHCRYSTNTHTDLKQEAR